MRGREVIESLLLLVCCDAPMLKPYLKEIVEFMATTTANVDFDDATRKMACEFLLSLAEQGIYWGYSHE